MKERNKKKWHVHKMLLMEGSPAYKELISTIFESIILDTTKVHLFSEQVNWCQGDGFRAWVHERVPLNLQWLVRTWCQFLTLLGC